MDKYDISTNHIDEQLLIDDINFIVIDKTTYGEVIDEIELNYILEMSDDFISSTSWNIPLSNSDFEFEWNVDLTDVFNEVPTTLELVVSASPDSSRIEGSDEYEFIIMEDNLYKEPISDQNIFRILGIFLGVVIVIGLISWGVTSLFKGGK